MTAAEDLSMSSESILLVNELVPAVVGESPTEKPHTRVAKAAYNSS